MTDIQALRAHLVAEAEHARREDAKAQLRAANHRGLSGGDFYETSARNAVVARLAADTRLRTLDALIARANG